MAKEKAEKNNKPDLISTTPAPPVQAPTESDDLRPGPLADQAWANTTVVAPFGGSIQHLIDELTVRRSASERGSRQFLAAHQAILRLQDVSPLIKELGLW